MSGRGEIHLDSLGSLRDQFVFSAVFGDVVEIVDRRWPLGIHVCHLIPLAADRLNIITGSSAVHQHARSLAKSLKTCSCLTESAQTTAELSGVFEIS